jgi:hypothetical protein
MQSGQKLYSYLPMVGGSLRVHLASSTTKTGRHDIAEILLKVELNIKNQPTIKRYVKYQATVNLLLL